MWHETLISFGRPTVEIVFNQPRSFTRITNYFLFFNLSLNTVSDNNIASLLQHIPPPLPSKTPPPPPPKTTKKQASIDSGIGQ